MLIPFIAFAISIFFGFVYIPLTTCIFLVVFVLLCVSAIGVDGLYSCIMALYPLPSDYNQYTCLLKGKQCLITGGNRGVGKGIVYELIKHNANIIVLGRSNLKEAMNDFEKIIKKYNSTSIIDIMNLDLSDFSSMQQCIHQLKKMNKKIDILILNAGLTVYPAKQTKDNIDLMTMVNYLCNVYIVDELVERQLFSSSSSSTHPRIVFTSSDSHRWVKYVPLQMSAKYSILGQVNHYARTKLYMQMFANYCVNKYNNIIDIYASCPGPVYTDIVRHNSFLLQLIARFCLIILFQSFERGGKHIVYKCMKPLPLLKNGTYHWMMHERSNSKDALNQQFIQELVHDSNICLNELKRKYNN